MAGDGKMRSTRGDRDSVTSTTWRRRRRRGRGGSEQCRWLTGWLAQTELNEREREREKMYRLVCGGSTSVMMHLGGRQSMPIDGERKKRHRKAASTSHNYRLKVKQRVCVPGQTERERESTISIIELIMKDGALKSCKTAAAFFTSKKVPTSCETRDAVGDTWRHPQKQSGCPVQSEIISIIRVEHANVSSRLNDWLLLHRASCHVQIWVCVCLTAGKKN